MRAQHVLTIYKKYHNGQYLSSFVGGQVFEDAVGKTAEPGHHDDGDRQGGHPEQGLHRGQAGTRAVPPKIGSHTCVHNITCVNERYTSLRIYQLPMKRFQLLSS